MLRKGASEEDIDFWVARRGWKRARSKDGRWIYGEELEVGTTCTKACSDGSDTAEAGREPRESDLGYECAGPARGIIRW
jgi:hypothetical protein